MEMLAVLVVLTLVPTWTDGIILKKCDLKAQLKTAFSEDTLSKLVCSVGKISEFDTSLVNDQYDTRTLLANPFQHGIDNYDPMDEGLVWPVDGKEDYVLPEGSFAPDVLGEDGSTAEVQPEGNVLGHVRKQRDSLFGLYSGEVSGEAEENIKDIFPSTIPPSTDNDFIGIIDDTYEMLYGHKPSEAFPSTEPPSTDNDFEGIVYDTYETLYGHKPSEAFPSTEPPSTDNDFEGIVYDTYEMIFGHSPTEAFPSTKPPSTDDDFVGPIYDSYETLYGHGPRPALAEPLEPYIPSNDEQQKFYGIFQLSEAACDSGSNHSPNICGLHCSDLTDDNITDDIACLKTLTEKMKLVFPQECLSVDPSQYFAECG